MRKAFAISALSVALAIAGTSFAAAGGRGGVNQNAGSNNPVVVSDKGKIHINQNGDGCRNRCYGTQTFNAGFNNGNTNVNVNHGKHLGWLP